MQISSGGLHTHALPLFALIVVSVLAVFWPTTRSMAEIWQQSSTYSHGYFVIPVAMWMASRESTMHGSIPVRPFWPGLAIIAAAGLVWLLGQLASVAVLAQFAAIGMVIATVLTVCGWRLARRLSFPLAFLFFAVPFGEGVLPLLMDWTADVTVWALRVTGMPVYREGNEFVIPSGRWSVIEACAGVRFLIAALMTGCIFAWHQYRTLGKRVVFLAAALGVALLANWLRAYVIVLMAHFSDNRFGASNHNTWGWLIFGIAMFALFAIGLRWSEPPTQTRIPTTRVAPAAVESWYLVLAAMVISLSTAATAVNSSSSWITASSS
ncbi:MAG: exosortase A, partial [Burkholderiaceae bacterium]